MRITLSFACGLVVLAGALECPIFYCNKTEREDGVCAEWIMNEMNLNMCDKEKICVPPLNTTEKGYCRAKVDLRTSFPGEYCTNTSQCLYDNQCVDNICKGSEEGHQCQHDGNCNVELYCDANKHCASPTKDCSKTGRCKSNEVCQKGVCVILVQLDNDQSASLPGACKSYFVHDEKCAEGPTLHGNDRSKCPKNGLCRYRLNGDTAYENPCICSSGIENAPYCAPGLGNLDLQDLTTLMLSPDRPPCHLSKGPLCINKKEMKDMSTAFLKAYKIYVEMTKPQVFGVTNDCVKKIYQDRYWEVKALLNEVTENSGLYVLILVLALGAVVIVTVLVIVYFMRRKRSPETETNSNLINEEL